MVGDDGEGRIRLSGHHIWPAMELQGSDRLLSMALVVPCQTKRENQGERETDEQRKERERRRGGQAAGGAQHGGERAEELRLGQGAALTVELLEVVRQREGAGVPRSREEGAAASWLIGLDLGRSRGGRWNKGWRRLGVWMGHSS